MTVPPGGGVLPVDKPTGPTSHDVVARVRKALGTRRVGHTGTLDPFASGLLLLVVGPATRISPFLTGLDKEYVATARLGRVTDTLDPEGRVVAESEDWRSLEGDAVAEALAGLQGDLLQHPPVFSAKKLRGEAAHRRVRRGEEVELPPVPVTVHHAGILELDLPHVTFSVRCSSGTYVRALARDLGEALGVGAYLTALRRTAVGGFRVDEAVEVGALEGGAPAPWIAPAGALALAGLASIRVDAGSAALLAHGRRVEMPEGLGAAEGSLAAAVDDQGLVAIVEAVPGALRPRKVFRPAESAS